jgi:isoleucyl-tRNA synthetase
MFKQVDPRQSFPDVEHRIMKYWEDNDIFEKSVKARKDRKKYVFFDGPPFANGLPHYGHILANALKDAVTRYWTMKGYYVPRTNGWDCHGLPVEYEIEKNLKLSGRKDIVDYGVDKFNDACRNSVFRYTGEWTEMFKRIGRWVDFDDTYATLDNSYMESIWWIFKQIWDKDMIYSGYKSMHICPRCETPLSNFEVTQGYKDVTDLSVTCKFKLKEDALEAISAKKNEDVYVLAWTTTPWTLPGNVALAFGQKVKYVKFAIKNFSEYPDGTYLAAENFYKEKFEHYDKVGEGKMPKYAILEKIDPKKLVGTHYEPLFDFYKGKTEDKAVYEIQLADFVTDQDGTGIVHIAPMFGEDDYQFGLKYDLAMIQHVEMNGCFTEDVKPWAGEFVKGKDIDVAVWLFDNGLLFEKQNFRHSYPHCWRCDTPLLNYSTRSLFIEVTKVKDKLLKNNEKINWVPDHIKDGRFGKWLDGARDWAISRNRFWGAPIPLWECSCGETYCIGSVKELEKMSGGKLPKNKGKLDLHKPYIDKVKVKCKKCGKNATRIPDVLDCWFESGAMPYAQLHYPFENKKYFEENFPANFIAEGLDQTRGWFYTLHVLSTILFDKPAFKNVVVNGILLAKDGEKLSKRKKNYPDPTHLFDSKGVDSLRYFLYSSTSPLGEDVRFSEDHVDEVVKKFTLTLWNVYSFFVTYANIDKFKPYDEAKAARFKPSNKLDQWILSELNVLIEEVTKNMDAYNLTWATRPMQDFLENLSNWYVRRSRRRFWKSENDGDKDQAYQTLYIVLTTFCKILAPFMPFISDEIFINLTGKKSVHMEDWPKSKDSRIDDKLNREMAAVRKVVNLGHSVRGKARIKVRQPLQKVQIALPRGIQKKWIKDQTVVILEELNVKELELVDEVGDIIEQTAMPNARVLGPKYGKEVQQIIQQAKSGKFILQAGGKVKVGKYVLENNEVEVGFRGKEGYDVESEDGVVVILDTNVTKGLVREGYAREIVRYIQEMRKEADFNVSDRIYLLVRAEGEIEVAVTEFADYIEKETLAIEISQAGELDYDIAKDVEVEGQPVKILIRKV